MLPDHNQEYGPVESLQGAVLSGTLCCGLLRVGDEIEIRPGIVRKETGGLSCSPLYSRVEWLRTASSCSLQAVVPGCLVHVGTRLDPTLATGQRLAGQVLGRRGTLPPLYSSLSVSYQLVPGPLIGEDRVQITLVSPVCAERGERVELLLRRDRAWGLVAQGEIEGGKEIEEQGQDEGGAVTFQVVYADGDGPVTLVNGVPVTSGTL